MFMKAKELSANTFNSISIRRSPNLLADNNPQPVEFSLILFHEEDEILGSKLPPCLHLPFEVLRIGYPFLSCESKCFFDIYHLQEF